jgi:hypothetical protein
LHTAHSAERIGIPATHGKEDDAITDAEIGVRSDLDHLAHIFMAEDPISIIG